MVQTFFSFLGSAWFNKSFLEFFLNTETKGVHLAHWNLLSDQSQSVWVLQLVKQDFYWKFLYEGEFHLSCTSSLRNASNQVSIRKLVLSCPSPGRLLNRWSRVRYPLARLSEEAAALDTTSKDLALISEEAVMETPAFIRHRRDRRGIMVLVWKVRGVEVYSTCKDGISHRSVPPQQQDRTLNIGTLAFPDTELLSCDAADGL